mgnify:CR=1 FL=1
MPHRYLGDELFVILAAVFGALTSALLAKTLTWSQKAVILLSGAGFAIFVGPAICEYLGIRSPYAIGATLYFGGILGNLLLIRILAWATQTDLIQMILDAYRGGKKP